MTLLVARLDLSEAGVETLLHEARRRRINRLEAVDLGFMEGLELARTCMEEWNEQARIEGVTGELAMMRCCLQEERRRLFAADVRNSQATFESYQWQLTLPSCLQRMPDAEPLSIR